MSNIEQIISDIFNDKIAIETLSDQQLCEAIDYLHDAAEAMQMDIDPQKVLVANAMVAILRQLNEEPDDFSEAIEAAEARGGTYWEFENPTVH